VSWHGETRRMLEIRSVPLQANGDSVDQ